MAHALGYLLDVGFDDVETFFLVDGVGVGKAKVLVEALDFCDGFRLGTGTIYK